MKAFADTNVLIYAVTVDDLRKQGIAQALLAQRQPEPLVISTQVLGEVYNVLTRRKAWVPAQALAAAQAFNKLRVAVPTADGVLRALQLAGRHQLSAWDALIVQAALEAGCDFLYSEDLQAGQRFGALQIVNPFLLQVQETGPTLAVPPKPRRAAPRRTAKPRKA